MQHRFEACLQEFRLTPSVSTAIDWTQAELTHHPAPHPRNAPPMKGRRALYAFYFGNDWLRIGQTAHRARFASHHYKAERAKSTLAADVWNNRHRFGLEGDEAGVGTWLYDNTGRVNLLFPQEAEGPLVLLAEAFFHFRLKPLYEGKRMKAGSDESAS